MLPTRPFFWTMIAATAAHCGAATLVPPPLVRVGPSALRPCSSPKSRPLPVAGDRRHAAAETDIGHRALLELRGLDALLPLRLLEDGAHAVRAGRLENVCEIEVPNLFLR